MTVLSPSADLVVMGAYGCYMRELLSGNCTQAVIGGADQPVLPMH